jgi:hemerythrin-like domain-containing protein
MKYSLIRQQDEHSSVYIANEMAFAHNAMIRGINSIFNQAPHVHKTEDIADFLFFVRSWANWVGHHHHLEETLMFSSFEEVMDKPGFLQANVEQHRAFEPGLKQLQAFANDTKPKDYKFETLQGIIQDFASGFQQHLHDEIPTLLAMRPYDSDALLEVYKKCEAVAGKQEKVTMFCTCW